MLASLTAELKAIQNWPCGELRTEIEQYAVLIREIRAEEIARKIREIASRNSP